MSKIEVISESFEITWQGGTKSAYLKTDDVEYQWATGPDGTLFIYKKQKHAMFGAIVKDSRIAAYAPGTWRSVVVLQGEEGNETRPLITQ